MSTHNICFRIKIRKIFIGYPPLSRPMIKYFEVYTGEINILILEVQVYKKKEKKILIWTSNIVTVLYLP